MSELERLTVADLRRLSEAFRRLDPGHRSMAEAAAEMTGILYRELSDAAGGPACVLVRVHVTQPLAALPPALQATAAEVDPGVTASTACLVSLASNGGIDRPGSGRPEEWVMPLMPKTFADLPLMPQLLEQIGLDLEAVGDPSRAIEIRLHHRSFNVYLASDLADDHVLLPDPAHRRMVRERGVRSLVAAAGVLPGGGVLMVTFQTRVEVSPEIAELLRPLATAIKASLIPLSRTAFAHMEQVRPDPG